MKSNKDLIHYIMKKKSSKRPRSSRHFAQLTALDSCCLSTRTNPMKTIPCRSAKGRQFLSPKQSHSCLNSSRQSRASASLISALDQGGQLRFWRISWAVPEKLSGSSESPLCANSEEKISKNPRPRDTQK